MAANPMITHRIIHAKESGNPKISGVAEEKIACPGQMMARDVISITATNMIRERRMGNLLPAFWSVIELEFGGWFIGMNIPEFCL